MFLTSCLGKKSTFNNNVDIYKLGTPIKLEFYEHLSGSVSKYSDSATFVITETKELIKIMEEIKNANNPEPWKGAGWNSIRLYYSDTIVNLNTNNAKIGMSASGIFYELEKENFITERMEITR